MKEKTLYICTGITVAIALGFIAFDFIRGQWPVATVMLGMVIFLCVLWYCDIKES